MSKSRVLFNIFIALALFGCLEQQSIAQHAKKGHPSPSTPAVAAPDGDSPLIQWKGGSVTLADFEAAYRRMNDRDPYNTTLDSLKDFLGVYADYRLKLEQAKEEGLDKDPKILAEIAGYRQLLAGPYWLDKEVTEPAVRRIFDRRSTEVHAAHFLAYVKDWKNPADTLKAYNKALRALEMMEAGYPISYVAMSPGSRALLTDHDLSFIKNGGNRDTSKMENWPGSDDRATAIVGGDLGYFTAGLTVRPFEDAVYSLQPGEYTKVPIKTRYGYHIIQLYSKEPHTGGVHVKHILIGLQKGADSVAAYKKADSVLQLIRGGASFEALAREVSDDKYTASRGGDFDTINREDRRAELAFDRAAYSLKDGEISGIVRTSFGYHIIKRVNGVPPKTYDEAKDAIKQFYKKYYFDEDKAKYLSGLHTKFHLQVDSSAMNYFMAHVDSSRTSADSAWAAKVGERSKPIFRMTGLNWTIGSLVDSLQAQQGAPLARNAIYDLIQKNIDDQSLDFAARDISTKYPDFERVMQDYKNGIVLFDLENRRVWSKVVPDSASEYKYYTEHAAKYFWPERIDISEIFTTSDSIAKKVYKEAMAGVSFDSLAAKYTERPGFKGKKGHWGLLQKDENELARRSFGFIVDEIKEPFSFQGGYSIVRVNRRDPIHPKTFQEARQEVASQYQDDRANELRTEWVEELRQKYGREINQPIIETSWRSHQPARYEGMR